MFESCWVKALNFRDSLTSERWSSSGFRDWGKASQGILSVSYFHSLPLPDLHTRNPAKSLGECFGLVFWEKNGWWGDSFYLKFWVNWPPLERSPILNRYSLVAHLSRNTQRKKSSINTNRKSTTRFPMSLRWSSYVAPKLPKRAQKRKTAVFRLKSHFAWRKSATKFFFCMKTVSDRVVRHSLT